MRPKGFKWYLSVVLPVLVFSSLVLYASSTSGSSSSMDCCSDIECNGKKKDTCSESKKPVTKQLRLPIGESIYLESDTTDIRCGYEVGCIATYLAQLVPESGCDCDYWEKRKPYISVSMQTQGSKSWKRLWRKWTYSKFACNWKYSYLYSRLWQKGQEVTPTKIIIRITYEEPVFTLPGNLPQISLGGVLWAGPELPADIHIGATLFYYPLE